MRNFATHFWKRFEQYKEHDAFVRPAERGVETETFWRWTRGVQKLALGLLSEGFEPNTRIGIVARNSRDWLDLAFAAWLVGGCVVPLVPGRDRTQTLRCLARAGCDWIALDDENELARIRGQGSSLPEHLRWITLEALKSPHRKHVYDLKSLAETGRDRARRGHLDRLAETTYELSASLPVLVLYPFDTGDDPHGAFFTGQSLAAMLDYLSGDLMLEESDRLAVLISYGWHYGILMTLAALLNGHTLAIADSLTDLQDHFGQLQPTVLACGPAFIEGQTLEWRRRLEQAPDFLRHPESEGAFGLGRALSLIGERAARKVLYEPMLASLGGNLDRIYLAGGTAPEDVLDILDQVDVGVLGLYGRPEFGISHVERPGARRRGSVGRPVQGYVCKIAGAKAGERGEILIKTDVAFKDYWDERGPRHRDEDGWIHTGDRGRIESGFLFVETP